MGKKAGKEQEGKPEATEAKVKAGLSRLGKTANGASQCYLDLRVEGTSMTTADVVKQYVNLQSIELIGNEITDLSAVSHLRFLTNLDASHNNLTELVKLEPPPKNLRSIRLAHNQISEMADISSYNRLNTLVLDGNNITQLSGINGLPFLKVLSVQNNELLSTTGIEGCHRLRKLLLNNNKIESLEPLSPLSRLEELEVRSNKLASLVGIEGITKLLRLDCRDNLLTEIEELRYGTPLQLLKHLDIAGNAIVDYHLSRFHIVYLMPQLEKLDGNPISHTDKVQAANLHGDDAEAQKVIRRTFFPDGELDDGGGAVVPVSAGLLASNGLDAKDDEVHFQAADQVAKTISQEVALQGIEKLGDSFIRKLPSQLALARACWTWVITNAADPPKLSWQVGLPTLKPEAAEAEAILLPEGTAGTYAEKLAQIFTILCRACQLEANEVLGFWKHDRLLPGTRMTSHNHCWNAVKVNGRWRLLDLFWAVKGTRSGYDIPFYLSPEAFVYTHLPLEEWWQLLGTYISPDQFWTMPYCSLFFFTKGFFFTNDDLNAVNIAKGVRDPSKDVAMAKMPVVDVTLEHPIDVMATHELLDRNLNVVEAKMQPGSYVFTQTTTRDDSGAVTPEAQDKLEKGLVSQTLWASLPEAGEYFMCIRIMDGPEVMMIKYVVEPGEVGRTVLFPTTAPAFHSRGCQIVSPAMDTILRGDVLYHWKLVVPEAESLHLMSSPEGSTALTSAAPSFYELDAPMARVPSVTLEATFKDGPTALLSYSVAPSVLDMVQVPVCPPSPVAQTARARDLFARMDLDKDGALTRGELAAGMLSNPGLAGLLGADLAVARQPLLFAEFFSEIDRHGRGRVDSEDLAAQMLLAASLIPHLNVELHTNGTGRVNLSITAVPPSPLTVTLCSGDGGDVRLSITAKEHRSISCTATDPIRDRLSL